MTHNFGDQGPASGPFSFWRDNQGASSADDRRRDLGRPCLAYHVQPSLEPEARDAFEAVQGPSPRLPGRNPACRAEAWAGTSPSIRCWTVWGDYDKDAYWQIVNELKASSRTPLHRPLASEPLSRPQGDQHRHHRDGDRGKRPDRGDPGEDRPRHSPAAGPKADHLRPDPLDPGALSDESLHPDDVVVHRAPACLHHRAREADQVVRETPFPASTTNSPISARLITPAGAAGRRRTDERARRIVQPVGAMGTQCPD